MGINYESVMEALKGYKGVRVLKVATPNPKAGLLHHQPVRRPRRRVGCGYALPLPALRHALCGSQGLLTDIGTEELGHMEMVAALVHQLTRNLSDEEVRNNASFAPYFVDHTTGVYPTAASGFPGAREACSPPAT